MSLAGAIEARRSVARVLTDVLSRVDQDDAGWRVTYSHRGFPGYPAARDISDIDTFATEIRRTYRSRYRAFRRRGPRLWLSEFTVSSDRPNRDFDFYVSRSAQARWLTAAYRIARREPYVAGLGWIGLLDEPPSVPRSVTFGLMTSDGKPKPAYYAYKRAR